MTPSIRLWFGPLAALIFVAGISTLATHVPGYSHVHQTVSEIGEVGSPMQRQFTALLIVIAFCVLVFASGVYSVSKAANRSTAAAWLLVCMAISAAGVGVYSSPHPLHNVFGLSELIGYQAPLAVALTWKRDPRAKGLVFFSWLMFALIWIAVILNLAPLMPSLPAYAMERPVYGLVQRSLFASFFVWMFGAGALFQHLTRD